MMMIHSIHTTCGETEKILRPNRFLRLAPSLFGGKADTACNIYPLDILLLIAKFILHINIEGLDQI
jgi:hypothetical protein